MIAKTPIYATLKRYREEKNLRLHMPGHAGMGGVLPKELKDLAGLDVTEIPDLGGVAMTQGVIDQSRRLMARAFRAQESFFLVNGSTSGIQALFLGSLAEGEKVLVPRNAHRSFYEGLVISGAVPVYLPCTVHSQLGIALAVKPEEVFAALDIHPEIKVVFLTSPSYYGTCSDLSRIAEVLEHKEKTLLVDEAHGTHFYFHPAYPQSALQAGAAAVVNSLHKTLPVLNQGSCLHLGKNYSWRDQLAAAWTLLTTTSPSYPLLASMEWARQFMEEQGKGLLERSLGLSREYQEKISSIQGLDCPADLDSFAVSGADPLKILISVKGLGLSGYQVARLLRDEYSIQVELAEQNLVLAMFSLLHDRADWERLYQALKDLTGKYPGCGQSNIIPKNPPIPQVVLSPRQAFRTPGQQVKLEESKGLVAGEVIAAYPPGIPCLLPGELINEEVWEYLHFLQKSEARIYGPLDTSLKSIRVLEPAASF